MSDLAKGCDCRGGGEDGGEERPRDEAPDHFRFFCSGEDIGQDLRLDEYDGDQYANREERDILQEQEARVISAVFHAIPGLYILRSLCLRRGRDREYAFLPQLKNSPPLAFGRVRGSRPVVLDGYPAPPFRIPPCFCSKNLLKLRICDGSVSFSNFHLHKVNLQPYPLQSTTLN